MNENNIKSFQKTVLKNDDRIGIINRGECAYRFIRAVKEYNINNNASLKTVVFYINDDKDAPFVKYADFSCAFEKIHMYSQIKSSPYINKNLLLKALDIMKCNAVWVGWGFVSEDSEFAELIEKSGRVLLGPTAISMARLGDKITAKEIAESAGVPVLPWSKKSVTSVDEAKKFAEEIGYPVIIKAANAGGGRGIRFAHSADEIEKQFNAAREETIRVTGGDIVFMEHFVESGRHLEVQTAADRYGNVFSFGVRDCSVQRKNQKIIEETPPTGIPTETLEQMQESARNLIKAAEYESVGTVEFIYCMKKNKFYFMEVNTRLQVEHPITEQLYNIDLVKIQIQVARNEELNLYDAQPRGYAIELRLNAEDPENNFTPAPGKILTYKIPAGPGIRIDSGIDEGSTIPTKFDSMIAKIIGYGQTRGEVFSRLERALDEINILIEGGSTNRSFLKELLRNPDIRKGGVSTRFVEELLSKTPQIIKRDNWELALIAAAIEQFAKKYLDDINNFKNQFNRAGHPKTIEFAGAQEFTITHNNNPYNFIVKYVGSDFFHIEIDKKNIVVQYIWEDNEAIMYHNNRRYIIQMINRGNITQCELNGVAYPLELESKGIIKSPTPAMVLSVAVKKGDIVAKNQLLVILEAMKMETAVSAQESGKITDICIREGEQISAGQLLIKLEPIASLKNDTDAQPLVKTEKFKFDETELDLINITKQNQDDVWNFISREYSALMLGFDLNIKPGIAISRILDFTERFREYNSKMIQLFVNSLEIYSDIETLFSNIKFTSAATGRPVSISELLMHCFKRTEDREKGMPAEFLKKLQNALKWYSSSKLHEINQDTRALFRIYRVHSRINETNELLLQTLFTLQELSEKINMSEISNTIIAKLEKIILLTKSLYPRLTDAAFNFQYILMNRYLMRLIKNTRIALIDELFASLNQPKNYFEKKQYIQRVVCESGRIIIKKLLDLYSTGNSDLQQIAYELIARRLNRDRKFLSNEFIKDRGLEIYKETSHLNENIFNTYISILECAQIKNLLPVLLDKNKKLNCRELILIFTGVKTDAEKEEIIKLISAQKIKLDFCSVGFYCNTETEKNPEFITLTNNAEGALTIDDNYSSFLPNSYREFNIPRFSKFKMELLYKNENIFLVNAIARNNKKDERLFVFVNVYDAKPEFSEDGKLKRITGFENAFMEAVLSIRFIQAKRKNRLYWNQIFINVHSFLKITLKNIEQYAEYLIPRVEGLGLEKIVIHTPSRPYGLLPADDNKKQKPSRSGGVIEYTLEFISHSQFALKRGYVNKDIIEPIDDYTLKIIKSRQRNCLYPYEIIKLITRAAGYIAAPAVEKFPRGEFEEFDIEIDAITKTQKTISVKNRIYGQNTGNIIFGIITNNLQNYDYPFKRVIILSDPTTDMGSLAEDECRRIIAALDLAEQNNLPVEWLPVSAGARIDMESGTENLDWTAAVLRRIIEFTQNGGEINIIVINVNVGAQSYWNAEATMLMHTKGILIMLEDASMLLTGKKALDYSGSVSAENNVGIGGVERIMGPNGQAQFRAEDIISAYHLLFKHYEFTYIPKDFKYPPKHSTNDIDNRNICLNDYNDTLNQNFTSIGDILLTTKNAERKKPFDMRQIMSAVIDTDAGYLERWQMMKDAENSIVWETRIGGYACGMLGIESKQLTRVGEIPNDGPENWTGGTLFPLSSKKTARAINAFSGKLPLVVLANLSGFDGSPESMRNCQLEFGSEIGRAIVNFRGPIIFVVISRYHGGAYVVFSKKLNDSIKAAAIEGSFASVIGGASAAAVVFNKQVIKDAMSDNRIIEAQKKLQTTKSYNKKEYDELYKQVLTEKQTLMAQQFDKIHSVERAQRVGSIDDIIKPENLREYIINNLK